MNERKIINIVNSCNNDWKKRFNLDKIKEKMIADFAAKGWVPLENNRDKLLT